MTDHPRSRGVYQRRDLRRGRHDGSSPLARGLLQGDINDAKAVRIIPARAGFTAGLRVLEASLQDHPRSRGVYGTTSSATRSVRGSSPLARGLLSPANGEVYVTRIIPARAGFTSAPSCRCSCRSDHPRSRGVYTCGSLESQRRATLPDRVHLHCRPSARSAEFR